MPTDYGMYERDPYAFENAYSQGLRNQLLMQQAGQQADQRNFLARPGMVDPNTGDLTQQAVTGAAQVSPEFYAQMGELRNVQRMQQMQYMTNKMDFIANVADGIISIYDNLRKQGVPESVARTSTQPAYEKGMAMLKGSGLLSPQEVQGLTPDFDPMDVSRTRMGSQKLRDQLRSAAAQQEKQAMEDRRLQLKMQEEMGKTAREQQRLDMGERRLESSERRADRREALQERAQQGTEEYRRWQEQRAEAADQAAMARREQMQTQQQATGARQDESLWIRKWSEMYKDPITGGPKEGAPSLEDFIKEHKASAYRQKQVQASGIDIDKERSDAMAEIARSKTPERKEKIRAMFKDVTGEDL